MSKLPSTSSSLTKSDKRITRLADKVTCEVPLIGEIQHQITGAKLPSNRQVLKVMFYNMRVTGFNIPKPTKLAVDATLIFWQQARILTRNVNKCVNKLKKIYEDWRKIEKVAESKRSEILKTAANEFDESLDDLFDIASANAIQTITIEEDRLFVSMQRMKGRQGCMAGVDLNVYGKEKR